MASLKPGDGQQEGTPFWAKELENQESSTYSTNLAMCACMYVFSGRFLLYSTSCLELSILLFQSPEWWHYRHESPHPAIILFSADSVMLQRRQHQHYIHFLHTDHSTLIVFLCLPGVLFWFCFQTGLENPYTTIITSPHSCLQPYQYTGVRIFLLLESRAASKLQRIYNDTKSK